MHVSQTIKTWINVVVFMTLALSFHRFRWGILGFVNIGPLPTACDNRGALDAYLRTGGDPEAYLGRRPLIMCATEKGNYEIVSRLIDLGVDIDAQKKRPLLPFIDWSTGTTALHVAVMEGNLEIAQVLFQNGADVNWEGLSSISPLNLSVVDSRSEFLKLFLHADKTNYEFDRSRIASAASNGNIETFRILFEADLHFRETYEAALANAAAQGHVQVVEFLYDHGISADTRSGITGRTALHLPAKLNRINVVKFLVNVGADINVMDNAGNTPLHYAAISNQAEIAKFLVDRGADINIKNNDGKIPLEAAVSHNSLEVVNILKKYSPY